MADQYDKYWAQAAGEVDADEAKTKTVQAPRRVQPRAAPRPHVQARARELRQSTAWSRFVDDASRTMSGGIHGVELGLDIGIGLVDVFSPETAQRIRENKRLAVTGATFGLSDKLEAVQRTNRGRGTYAENQRAVQAETAAARKRNGIETRFGDIAPAEIAGGMAVPFGAGVRSVKGLAALGGVEGFIGGIGYSDKTDIRGMLGDGVRMIPWGIAFGTTGGVIAKGVSKVAAVRLKSKAPKPEAPEAPAQVAHETPSTPAGPARVLDEVPEEGALVTSRALKDAPEAAIEAAQRRITTMTDDEAAAMMSRIEQAEETGDLLDDPHYRSILNVDLSDVETAPDKLLRAINALEEIHESLADRVASRTVSTRKVDADVRQNIHEVFEDDQIAGIMERSGQGIRDARVAMIMQSRAGIEAVRARDEYLEALSGGTEGALETLKQKLGRALYVYNAGAAVRSNQGRQLQIGQEANSLLDDAADAAWELDQVQLTGKLEETFNNLGPDGLKNLLNRLRTGDDLSEVMDVLSNEGRSKAVGMFTRTAGTFEAFLKSNGLTPVTAVFNSAGVVLNDAFRNNLSRRWMAAKMARDGHELEAIALRAELEASQSVYWQAHLHGLKVMLDRVKYEWFDSVESVAGAGFGSGKVRAKASASKRAIAAKGTIKTEIRDVSSMNPGRRLRVNDLDGFNARMDELASQGGFAPLWAGLQRTGAVAVNTVDALGTASGKLFTGAVDDWGRNFVLFKEKYALAARSAAREGLDLGLSPDDLGEFVKRRGREKAELPDEEMWARAEESILRNSDMTPEVSDWMSRKALAETEANKLLFLDGPQTKVGKASAQLLGLDKLGVIFPYVKTPIRLLEVGLGNYTMLGKFTKEGKDILRRGGPEAAMFQAQMELGTTLQAIGLMLGAAGVVKVTNGGWTNTKNIDSDPPNRIQIGDFHAEFGRLDPFSTVLAVGATFGQAAREGFHDYEQYRDYDQALGEATAALGWGFKDAVLSKSYLKSLSELIEVVSGGTGGPSVMEKIAGSVSARLVPLGGTQKLVNDTLRENAPEASSIMDQVQRNVVGLGYLLPDKRNILGDEIEGRDLGVTVGLSNDTLDDVGQTLKDLGIDLTDFKRTDPAGFRLTGTQLNRLRELRGHEAMDSEGRNLREALRDLFMSEDFELMGSKEGKQSMVAEVVRDFNKPARELLDEEDPTYAAKRAGYASFEAYIKEGQSVTEATESAEKDAYEEFGEYIDIE